MSKKINHFVPAHRPTIFGSERTRSLPRNTHGKAYQDRNQMTDTLFRMLPDPLEAILRPESLVGCP